MKGAAPDWVREALVGSQGPRCIADALVASEELALLWDKLPEASRPNVEVLPFFLAGMLPTKGGRPQRGVTALSWSAAKRPAEQADAARRVVEAAAALNAALRDFAPLADVRVHQLFPQEDHELHMMLAGLPVAGHRDCLLSRLGAMAGRFQPERSSLVKRPNKPHAKRTELIRKCHELTNYLGFQLSAGDHFAFVAGLVNVLDPTAEADADTVKESLRRWRVS